MSSFIKAFLIYLAEARFFWWLFKPFLKVCKFMNEHRDGKDYALSYRTYIDFYNEKFHKIIGNSTVCNGPFKGLMYPSLESFGSALYPKLIGSYEMELHGIMEKICNNHYGKIINIGCGEGYYAAGLALRFRSTKIYAFDMDDNARALTLKMAEVNNVQDRLVINSICTAEYLMETNFEQKGLIICDCEGCERSIFNNSNIENLKKCDLLIETHDFKDINITSALTQLFSSTHTIIVIKSLDDIEKAKTYIFDEAKDFDLETRKVLFGEGRPAIMEWYYLEPKV